MTARPVRTRSSSRTPPGAARTLARVGADYRVVYVGRSRASMAYVDLLAAEHGGRLRTHVDDEGTALDVTALVAGAAAPGRQELLMCGPVRLVDAVRRAWAAAGAELMWDCLKGECGLCEMAVERVEGRLDHRDVFLSDEQKAAGGRVCLCVGRAVAGEDGAPARLTLARP